ncbi:MAG: SDR family oxidoreductase [Candidatus Levyibacteriota bacterium]|jgi:nucleoside-diphosphate-sugar epimerase
MMKIKQNSGSTRKKVLVTGSLGYLGSVLTGYLEQNGFDCLGYDAGFFRNCLLYKPAAVRTVFGDAREITEKDLKGIDVLVHLAGVSNDPFGDLDAKRIYDPTRVYAEKVAKLCKRLGIKFIFASSCSVYGLGQDKLLTEDSPTYPQTPYSLNKLQIEQDLEKLSDRNFSPVALRFATAFGMSPRMRFDIVVNMLTGMAFTTSKIILNSDGKPWRPNVHVLDICKAIRFAIDSDYNAGKILVLNVGDEQNNLQIIDIAKAVQAELPSCELKFLSEDLELDKEDLVRDRKVKGGVDRRTYKVSFAKIRKVFPSFKCDWTVNLGIQEMLKTFQAMKLTEAQFKKRDFYRLQTIERLYQEHFLSSDLRWLKAKEER